MRSAARHQFWQAFLALSAVLYLAGLLGFFLLEYSRQSRQLSDWTSQVPVLLELTEELKESDLQALQTYLEAQAYVQPGSLRYVPKDEAFALLEGEFSEEDLELLGGNPMPDMVEFSLKPGYTPKLADLRQDLLAQAGVDNLVWVSPAEGAAPRAWFLLALLVLGLMLLLLAIGLTLSQHSLKFWIYAEKAQIQSRNWAGAKPDYIAEPYRQALQRFAWQSIALVALALIFTWLVLIWQLPEQSRGLSFPWVLLCLALQALLGYLLYRLSAERAIRRYLLPLLD